MKNSDTQEESIAIARESRGATLPGSRSPWWYHLASGLILGAAVVLVLLLRNGMAIGVTVGLMAMAVLEVARYRATGTKILDFNRGRATFNRGRATIYAVLFSLIIGLVIVIGWSAVRESGIQWMAWAVGIVVATLMSVSGWVFERTFSASTKHH